jgi:uncharacterized protein YjbJ (UPF0337 family)
MSDSTKDRLQGGFDKVKGMAKEKMGEVTNDDEKQAEGQMDQVKGEAKEGKADAKDKVDDVAKKFTGN